MSLEWKVEGVTDGENEGGDCNEVVCAEGGKPRGQWTEHDTIEEFNVDSKAEYSALSSTRSQKLKQTNV